MTQTTESDQRDNILISDKGIGFKFSGSQKGFEGWDRETLRQAGWGKKREREKERRNSLVYWLITAWTFKALKWDVDTIDQRAVQCLSNRLFSCWERRRAFWLTFFPKKQMEVGSSCVTSQKQTVLEDTSDLSMFIDFLLPSKEELYSWWLKLDLWILLLSLGPVCIQMD